MCPCQIYEHSYIENAVKQAQSTPKLDNKEYLYQIAFHNRQEKKEEEVKFSELLISQYTRAGL